MGANSVTVNGNAATLYADGTFAKTGVSWSNGNNTYTAVASDGLGRGDTNAVTVNIQSSLSRQYDAKGNLTNDSVRSYFCDDENRLVATSVPTVSSNSFSYDGLSRKRIDKQYSWIGGTWVKTQETRYLYDGAQIVQERDANNLPTTTYTRGLDLSGSRTGAGGIGGLLARTDNGLANISPSSAHNYYHSDGLGNITAMLNAQQAITARHSYDPFGNVLGSSGPNGICKPIPI